MDSMTRYTAVHDMALCARARARQFPAQRSQVGSAVGVTCQRRVTSCYKIYLRLARQYCQCARALKNINPSVKSRFFTRRFKAFANGVLAVVLRYRVRYSYRRRKGRAEDKA
jgi:hypothetical protein